MSNVEEMGGPDTVEDLDAVTIGMGPWEHLGPYPKKEGAVLVDIRDFLGHYGVRATLRSDDTLRVVISGGTSHTLVGGGKFARDILERIVVRLARMRGVSNRAITHVRVDTDKGETYEANLRDAEAYVGVVVDSCCRGSTTPFKNDAAIRLLGVDGEVRGGKKAFLALAYKIMDAVHERQETAVSLRELPPFQGPRSLSGPTGVLAALTRNWEWMRYLCDLSLATEAVVAREVTGRVPRWSRKQFTAMFRALVGPWENWEALGLGECYNGFDVCCCYVVIFRKQQGQARITADGPRYLDQVGGVPV